MAITRLTVDDVMLIRQLMSRMELAARDAFGQTEPLNKNALESAVFRQHTAIGGVFKYNKIEEIGANLFYGIAMNHAFENGNKRTALVSLLIFLDKNRHILVSSTEDELYEFARKVANHELPSRDKTVDSEVEYISKWIKERIRGIVLGDTNLEFGQLKDILKEFDCEFEKPRDNFIKPKSSGGGPLKPSSAETGRRLTPKMVRWGQLDR
ncbi:type II toxin-antitoxin system death-on-curing family toxin [Desulfovibrio aminophilus]|uniref:type II toxin-antitoxin system death-on-curing family toxin n=1 Tax=Desulfovibrio aminophilus TaxID=81425 RepID=UPI000A04DCDF|nr:type II toxin-antitoxin system death-on-curing family toxin [Desulfovibrio aminophilus]